MIRPGLAHSLAAVLAAGATFATIVTAGSDRAGVVSLLLTTAGIVFTGSLLLGAPRLLGVSSAPVIGAAVLALAEVEGTQLATSALIGCIWYLTLEIGWEAIDLRSQPNRSAAVVRRRFHEVTTVIGVATAMAVLAAALAPAAPVRTLLIQVLLMAVLIGTLSAAIQRTDPGIHRSTETR